MSKENMQAGRLGLSLVLGLGLIGGCVGGCPPKRQNTEVFKQLDQFRVSSYQYIIDPPDQIIVRAPRIPELDPAPRTVGPDGKVTFNLIGSVEVAGKTPEQVADLMRKLVTKYYSDPDIKIEVIANSKFIMVFGPGATQPGKFPYTGRNSVVGLLADSGINEAAWPEQVIVNRPSKKARTVIDFTRMYKYGDMDQNYLLEEGDLVYLERNPLSQFNFKMTQILGPLTGGQQVARTTYSTVRPGAPVQ